MPEMLNDVQARNAETSRAAAEGREPDYSPEHLALYAADELVPGDVSVKLDETSAQVAVENAALPEGVTGDSIGNVEVAEVNEDASVTDSSDDVSGDTS